MTLSAGDRLGRYEILGPLGAGGMGEVYRAHDERLDRDVAVKVLHEAVAEDEARLARFEREAKLLASLSHQNIATLFGLEEHEGQRFLVMELAEGETLAKRLGKGPIPIEDALPTALQIAEGLEAAHEQGIIHRDLKPANVMLSSEGKVKILDFGLAKAWHDEVGDAEFTDSPTLTAPMTAAGVLVGTAAYMSPEQARGKPIDKRADIWAFGCCLYEILTGQRVFTGESTTDVLTRIISTEPDWQILPKATPWRVQDLLRRCLVKDPRNRLHDIGDARIALAEVQREGEPASIPPEVGAAPPARTAWWYAVGGLLVGAAAVALVLVSLLPRSEPEPRPVRRYSISLPPDAPVALPTALRRGSPVALSPDGRWLVYVARHGSNTRLMKRRLDGLEFESIPGTNGAGSAFFSPDSRWIGFQIPFPVEQLSKVPVRGGRPVILCRVEYLQGAAWQDDGTIVFAAFPPAGVYRVPESGGAVELVTVADGKAGEEGRLFPQPLPGGKGLLLTVVRTQGPPALAVLSPSSGELSIIAEGAGPGRYLPTGHIVYPDRGRLVALPFDLPTLTATGDPVDVTEPGMDTEGYPLEWAASADGTLAYVPVHAGAEERRILVWKHRDGGEEPVGVPPPQVTDWAQLSPDGQRIAVNRPHPVTGDWDVWIYDLGSGTSSRLTHEPGYEGGPLWTPDGQRIVFASHRTGVQNLYWKNADGIGEAERLTESEYFQFPSSWSPDGKILFYEERGDPELNREIWALYFDEDPPRPMPLLQSQFNEMSPAISPDGRWLAYECDETGEFQVWVRPFPEMDRKLPVSIDGGNLPMWHPQGDSIFFFDRQGRLMEARVQTQPTFSVTPPNVVLDGQWDPVQLDITPDGERFLLVKIEQEDITELIVVENWFEVLKRKAPPGKVRRRE